MRIISGKWGGRKLVSFTSDAIRPTTDRVKETIFNMIGPDIVDADVLDLFSGTGNLGFEALSRGAKSVLAVDKGMDAKKVMLRNKDLLAVGDEYRFVSKDVVSFLSRENRTFDFVLVDPPFTQKMGAEVIRALSESEVLKADTRIFIECVKGEEVLLEAGDLVVEKTKNYGDKFLYSYILKG